MTAARTLERELPAGRAALVALTPGEQGLVTDFAEAHGFPWEDYADVFDDLCILGGREPAFQEVVRVLLGRYVAVLRDATAGMVSPVDLSDVTALAVWVDRCLEHFLPLDRELPGG